MCNIVKGSSLNQNDDDDKIMCNIFRGSWLNHNDVNIICTTVGCVSFAALEIFVLRVILLKFVPLLIVMTYVSFSNIATLNEGVFKSKVCSTE